MPRRPNPTPSPSSARTGAETRAEAQRVALALFSEQGYEATSMQQIADALGIRKASLYYHFAGKEEIVRSLLADRGDEAGELAAWVEEQKPSAGLARETVLRWIDAQPADKLRGLRLLAANPLLVRAVSARSGVDVGASLERVLDALVARMPPVGGAATARRRILLRMAFGSLPAALASAADVPDATEADAIAAARAAALALAEAADSA